jgi:DNA repair protein RadC
MKLFEEIDIVKIQMVRDGSIHYGKKQITNPRDLVELGQKFLKNADREMFVMVCLNIKNHINCIHLVSMGTINHTVVSPREVMKAALLSNATAIAFIHNHPSGDAEPSVEDVQITEKLVRCGELFEIRVLDHVIISDESNYVSFLEKGLIGQDLSMPQVKKDKEPPVRCENKWEQI